MKNAILFFIILYLNSINYILCLYFLKNYLHIFQLKSYSVLRYLKSLKKFFVFLIGFVFILILEVLLSNFYLILILNVMVLICSIFINSNHKSQKTPLVFTSRIKNQHCICALILIIFIPFRFSVALSNILITLLPIISYCLDFIDKIKNASYIKSARKKLNLYSPKIIAITGSNGKTTTKNILLEILRTKYKVQATPFSYNTPLGISKFINESLNRNTEFLILEYGARKIGDIKKLCKLFGADMGILTTIAPQHIESFKSLENVITAKKELPDFLGEKFCAYNLDNPYLKTIFEAKVGEKIGVLTDNSCHVPIDKKTDADASNLIYASNYQLKNFITKFEISYGVKTFEVKTKLLGKQNITNILLCVAVAKYLKLTDEEIKIGIENIKQIPHRLEHSKSIFNIIDDSYNCSILSAKYALDIMKTLDGKKMIVTPGIVECGKKQHEINFSLGKMLSDFDYIVIVGDFNKKSLIEGIKSNKKSTKMLMDNLFTIKNLEEVKTLYYLLSKDDTILFLNDLPDDYD